MAKGDKIYAGSDEDARWIPEGAALHAYMQKRKERAKMADKGEDTPAVAHMPPMDLDDDTPAATINPDTVEVEGDDTEVSEPVEESEEIPEEPAAEPEKIIGLTEKYGGCPKCATPSSRVISENEDGSVALRCASGHNWTSPQHRTTG